MLEASAGESDSQGRLHLTAATWLFLMPNFWHMSLITSPNLHRDMSWIRLIHATSSSAFSVASIAVAAESSALFAAACNSSAVIIVAALCS